MDEPIFVIHGVGNRDQRDFAATVAALEAAAGVPLHPIYWGDLGANDSFVELALPQRRRAGLRDDDSNDPDADEMLTALLEVAAPSWPGSLPQSVRQAVRDGLDTDSGSTLRDGPSSPDCERLVLEVLTEEWPNTRWLSRTDDVALLHETGIAIADTVMKEAEVVWSSLRGPTSDEGGLRALIRRRLNDLDRVAGAAMQAIASRVNHNLRARLGPGATRFLGDVLVYQRHRATIQARIREHIAAVDPRLGQDATKPVRIVAHSLGGVIAVDMATADIPLWTSSLLTFGSQAAYFHLCDPRGGQLPVYTGSAPVTLPGSLARWTNLWQPLDMLAFAASRVFRLADGSSPDDIPLSHTVSAGLWTHSVYWSCPELAAMIRKIMCAG
ncbi:hypothetical protein [Streptomyces sp. NPDC091215]|uniref:hypothetical protein n=1 Tax=Streptomyces sp. NPDC091215 TaxID=3155192 RepID=UPI00342DF977